MGSEDWLLSSIYTVCNERISRSYVLSIGPDNTSAYSNWYHPLFQCVCHWKCLTPSVSLTLSKTANATHSIHSKTKLYHLNLVTNNQPIVNNYNFSSFSNVRICYFSFSCMIVNWIALGFGLLVRKKTFADITFYLRYFFDQTIDQLIKKPVMKVIIICSPVIIQLMNHFFFKKVKLLFIYYLRLTCQSGTSCFPSIRVHVRRLCNSVTLIIMLNVEVMWEMDSGMTPQLINELLARVSDNDNAWPGR